MSIEKPLFIPLKAEYFNAFESGEKREELRLYGQRWNERTCRVGRAITLSYGYGKSRRMHGKIWAFKKQRGTLFGSTYKRAILDCYGTLEVDIAVISIDLSGHPCPDCNGSMIDKAGVWERGEDYEVDFCRACNATGLDYNKPPCRDCGAKTAKEAESKCTCNSERDYCHGCELWEDSK